MTTGKKTQSNEGCTICGTKDRSAAGREHGLCRACTQTVTLLRRDPDAGRLLAELAGVTCPAPQIPEQELPDVLDGVRYRTTDRDRNTWYVSVSVLDGNPVEIFASTAFDRDHHLQSRISNLTTITRLISLILRHIFIGERLTLEKTLTQLHRSSRLPNDLPDMLGRVLGKYLRQKAQADDQETVIP